MADAHIASTTTSRLRTVLLQICPRLSVEQQQQEDVLSLLPPHLLQAVVKRLSLRDVWSLWQTSRAMQTAVRQCEWVKWVGLSDFYVRETGLLLAVRMFAPGGVRLVQLGGFTFREPSGRKKNLTYARRAWECLAAHAQHVDSLDLVPNMPLTFFAHTTGKPSRHPRGLFSFWDVRSPKGKATLSLAHFASLRNIVIALMEDDKDRSIQLAALSQLPALTCVTVRYEDERITDPVDVVLRLPGLRKLVLKWEGGSNNLILSEGALSMAARLECVELHMCKWDRGIPGWLGKLSALAQVSELKGETLDLTTLAGLPALRSLQTFVSQLTTSSHCLTSAFPRLRLLDLSVSENATLDFGMLSSLEELRLWCGGTFTPMGTLASLSMLTSLDLWINEVCVGESRQHGLHLSIVAGLRNLKTIKLHLGGVQRPLDFSVLAHVRSVHLKWDAGYNVSEEAHSFEQLTSAEVLGCHCPDPFALMSWLSCLSSLTSLELITGGAEETTDLNDGISHVQRQQQSVPFVLPQLRRLRLQFPHKMDKELGRMLPNVVCLDIFCPCAQLSSFPAVPVGAWLRLQVLKIEHGFIESLPHTWFTLPSLRSIILCQCHLSDPLPEIPVVPEGERAPLRDLVLVECGVRSVPQTITNLQELTRIWVDNYTELRLPKNLEGSHIKVMFVHKDVDLPGWFDT